MIKSFLIIECPHRDQGLPCCPLPLLHSRGPRLHHRHHGPHERDRGVSRVRIRHQGLAHVLCGGLVCSQVRGTNHQNIFLDFDGICSGSRSTPSTSILSKCVPPSQLGKIFSVTQAVSTLISMAMGYLSTQVSQHIT